MRDHRGPVVFAIMKIYSIIIALCLISLTGASESGIVGGKTAKPHSRKYMASLQFYGHHICGGFLIREDFVLTAAHCTKMLPMTVVLGAHNVTKKEKSQQRIKVEKYFQHPNFRGEYEFDIMLLKLQQNATLNEFVKTIDLPKTDKEIPANIECTVLGWGRTKSIKDSPASDVLREAVEKIQFNSECRHIWKEYFKLDHMICTKFTKKSGGMCQGDSGGPLVCKNKPVGISAYTKPDDCNDPKYPHVYMKISSFLPWIRNAMNDLDNVA